MRHELYLARAGLAGLAAVAVVLVTAGWVVAGRNGSVSAAAGALVVAANHAGAAVSTGWARRLGPGVLAAGYGVFVLRMVAVMGALALLRSAYWVRPGILAVSLALSVAVSLATEWVSFARGTYVPAYRRRS